MLNSVSHHQPSVMLTKDRELTRFRLHRSVPHVRRAHGNKEIYSIEFLKDGELGDVYWIGCDSARRSSGKLGLERWIQRQLVTRRGEELRDAL